MERKNNVNLSRNISLTSAIDAGGLVISGEAQFLGKGPSVLRSLALHLDIPRGLKAAVDHAL